MFCEFGCNHKLSLELEVQLSKDSQQKFDEIQRLGYYFMINANNLNNKSAMELITMPDDILIAGSDVEKLSLEHLSKLEVYDELIKQDLSKGSFVCKCGSVISCKLEQRRSADEGQTAIIKCCNPKCGKRWKL